MAACALLVGGILLGMTQASGSAAPASGKEPDTVLELAKPSRHYLVGTVAELLPPAHRAIVRGNGGRFFVVDVDASTVVRGDRQRLAVTALRRGTRVIILGESRDGHYHADVITITGKAPARSVPQTPAAPSATPLPARPFLAPTPTVRSGLQ